MRLKALMFGYGGRQGKTARRTWGRNGGQRGLLSEALGPTAAGKGYPSLTVGKSIRQTVYWQRIGYASSSDTLYVDPTTENEPLRGTTPSPLKSQRPSSMAKASHNSEVTRSHQVLMECDIRKIPEVEECGWEWMGRRVGGKAER